MEKQNNGVITDKNFKSNKDELISNKEKQIEEMANILNEYMCEGFDDNRGCCFCRSTQGTCTSCKEMVMLSNKNTAQTLVEQDYRKVVMCKDCAYCEEHHYEEEGEKPYIKLTCKWSKYAHQPTDFCSCAKMRGE